MDGSLGIIYGVAFTVCEASWDSGSCVPNLFVVVSLSWMVDTLDDAYERKIIFIVKQIRIFLRQLENH